MPVAHADCRKEGLDQAPTPVGILISRCPLRVVPSARIDRGDSRKLLRITASGRKTWNCASTLHYCRKPPLGMSGMSRSAFP